MLCVIRCRALSFSLCFEFEFFFESVFHTFQTHTTELKNGEKEGLWQCEKERERDERIRENKRGSVLGGEIVVSSLEWIGVASQGCVCVARASN